MGSALFGWAFTLTHFAKVYSKKFAIDKEKMMEKLWGDNFYDKKGMKWKNHNQADDGSKLQRAFVGFIMEPVIRLCNLCLDDKIEELDKVLNNLQIILSADER